MTRLMFISLVLSCVGFQALAAKPRVNLKEDIRSVEAGSYLLIEQPMMIKAGTTALLVARTRTKPDRNGAVPGASCEMKLSKATGLDIFHRNYILKSQTKLFVKSDGNDLALVDDAHGVRIPLSCRLMVKQKKHLVPAPRMMSISQFAQTFSFFGTLYVVEPQAHNMASR